MSESRWEDDEIIQSDRKVAIRTETSSKALGRGSILVSLRYLQRPRARLPIGSKKKGHSREERESHKSEKGFTETEISSKSHQRESTF